MLPCSVLLLLLSVPWLAATADHDYDRARDNGYDHDLAVLAANEANALLPSTPSLSRKIAAAATHYCDLLDEAAGTWPDLVASGAYNTSDQRVVWPAAVHMQRVKTMAMAAADVHGSQKGNASLLRGADLALRGWVELNLTNANWWQNQIGIPMMMADALLMMQQVEPLPTGLLGACNDCRTCLNQAVPGTMTGANFVWLTRIAMQDGVLRGNATRVGKCLNLIYGQIRRSPRTGDGIMSDASFHQHGPQLLSGSYGGVFAASVSELAAHAAKTRWRLPASKLRILSSLLLDGDQWSTDASGARWDFSVVGREIARRGGGVRCVGVKAEHLRALGGERAQELEQFAARVEACVRNDGNDTTTTPLVGHRAFWDSDYAVQKGVAQKIMTSAAAKTDDDHSAIPWTVTLHMRSNRTIGSSCVNGEARPTEHLSDGITAIYVDPGKGNEDAGYWGSPSVDQPSFPAMDWQRLPGLTAEVNPSLLRLCDSSVQKFPKWTTSFVGTVSDGAEGVSAMDLWSHNLTAAKSWFTSEEEGLLVLGSRVTVASSNPAITTLDVRRYFGDGERNGVMTSSWGKINVSDVNHLWRGGNSGDGGSTWWLWYDHVGYVISSKDGPPGLVNVTLKTRTGDWHYMSEAAKGTFHVDLLQIELSDYAQGSFAYRVLPGVPSSEDMPSIVANSKWKVRNNTADLQLVTWEDGVSSSLKLRAVFWKAGAASFIEEGWPSINASAPCLLMVNVSDQGADIAVASPDNGAGPNVVIGIGGLKEGLRCSGGDRVTSEDGTSGAKVTVVLPAGELMGNTTRIRCEVVPTNED